MDEQETFGWRQLLGHVNLRDFAHMVGGELAMIGGSLRRALEVLPHLPLGPFVSIGLMLLAVLRSVLLLLVVVFFGAAILVISGLRSIGRIVRRV